MTHPARGHITPTSGWRFSSSPPLSDLALRSWRHDELRQRPNEGENHMSVHQPVLESLGDHDYLVRFEQDGDTVVVRVYADPAVVAQIADDEQRVVEATAAYLIARQSAEDLPE